MFQVVRRRSIITLAVVVSLALTIVALVRSGDQPGVQAQTPPGPVAGEFVGTVTGQPHLFVAVVADPETQAGARQVRAYVCDGEQVAEWFVSSVAGNSFDVTNEGGVRFVGDLTDAVVTGRIVLPVGVVLLYEAPRATGVAGLYEVEVTPDGQIRGISVGGVRYEGQIMRDPQTGELTARRGFILPDGEYRALTTPLSGQPLGVYRVIVQADMSLRGAATTVRSAIATTSTTGVRLGGPIFYFACFTLMSAGRDHGLDPVRCQLP